MNVFQDLGILKTITQKTDQCGAIIKLFFEFFVS